MPATAPLPQQPTPVEIQSWQGGLANARQQYEAQLAQNQYGRSQATLGHEMGQRQFNYNQGQQRQTFDDPYIGRGIFKSGIRGAGLSNFYTQGANQQANAQQQYLQQMGQYGLNEDLALRAYEGSQQNIAAQEAARRAQLAAEIKGIT